MIKKIIAFMALACFAFTQASFAFGDGRAFPDVPPNHWAYNNVKVLKDLGIVVGYPDGLFRPDAFVTRAEFSSMAVKAVKLLGQPFVPTNYKDLPKTHWGYNNIQIASYFGLVSGNTDANFRPNDDVRRIEVISVIMSALNLEELKDQEAITLLDEYKDANLTPEWALVKTAQAKRMDMLVIMPGREGYIEPLRPATRGELAVFLTKMMDAFAMTPSERIAKVTGGEPKEAPPEKPKVRKVYDGIIVENAYIDGDYAILPAGTILPLAVMACTQSEKTKTGHDFRARATKNFITKDKRLIIPVGSQLYGVFQDIVKPKLFLSNSRLLLASNTMKMNRVGDESIPMNAVAKIEAKYHGKTLWDKINFYFIKNKSTPLHKSAIENFVLLEPVRIQIRDEWVTF